MAKLGKGLDLSGVRAFGVSTVLPAGNYNAKCVETEMKETNAGGHMIVAKFSVVDGDYAGCEVKEMFNVVNKNETAVRIGLSKIKAVLEFGGHKNPNMIKDSDEMVGLTVGIVVSQNDESFVNEKGETVDFKRNTIEGYRAVEPVGVVAKIKEAVIPKKEKAAPKKEEKVKTEESTQDFPWG